MQKIKQSWAGLFADSTVELEKVNRKQTAQFLQDWARELGQNIEDARQAINRAESNLRHIVRLAQQQRDEE